MDLCKKAKLAAEVALGPVAEFDFDVSILFSDLLFPLEALGMGLKYDPSPELGWHLTPETLSRFRPHEQALSDLQFQAEALKETRKVLPSDKSLIGFVGGPWTLFSYAVEGEHKGGLTQAKSNLSLLAGFRDTILPLLESNIELQLSAGAEVVMIFDTAAGELSPSLFHRFLVPDILRFARRFPGRIGYYSKGTHSAHLQPLRSCVELAGLGIDHRFDIASELLSHKTGFLQGCFDQSLLFLPDGDFDRELDSYLRDLNLLTPDQRRGWVCGLGHGVLPGTPEAHVKSFVRRVREVLA